MYFEFKALRSFYDREREGNEIVEAESLILSIKIDKLYVQAVVSA